MKYQVGIRYEWEGEISIEADTEDEAKERAKEILFSEPFESELVEEESAFGNHTAEIVEIYEWDEAAQKKFQEEINSRLEKWDDENKKNISEDT